MNVHLYSIAIKHLSLPDLMTYSSVVSDYGSI